MSKVSVFNLEQIWSLSYLKIAWLQLRLRQKFGSGSGSSKKNVASSLRLQHPAWVRLVITRWSSNQAVSARRAIAFTVFSSVRRIFERRGGAREFRKFEISGDENENFPAQNQVCFCGPKLGKDQKKKVFTQI